jgi:multidrug resistance efflux pump
MGDHFAPISKERYAELLAAEAALAAAEAERDEQRKDTEAWYRQSQVLSAECDRLEQRATVLAALEQAAQAWDRQHPFCTCWLCRGLAAALRALAAPPGEEA